MVFRGHFTYTSISRNSVIQRKRILTGKGDRSHGETVGLGKELGFLLVIQEKVSA